MAYAEQTTVSPEKSRMEISEPGRAGVVFELEKRRDESRK